jgi:hypothetical protein
MQARGQGPGLHSHSHSHSHLHGDSTERKGDSQCSKFDSQASTEDEDFDLKEPLCIELDLEIEKADRRKKEKARVLDSCSSSLCGRTVWEFLTIGTMR